MRMLPFISKASPIKKLLIVKTFAGKKIIEHTLSGAVVTFVTNLVKPLKVLIADINPVQDLHGYDHPWPEGGSKNLWPSGDQTFTQMKKISFGKTYPAGAYVLSADIQTSASTVRFVLLNGNTEVTGGGSNVINGHITFGLSATDLFDGCYLYAAQDYPSGQGVEVKYTKIQLEAGSTETSYVPYSNICPISGWTGAKVTRTGKNLAESVEIGGYTFVSGEAFSNAKYLRTTKVPVKSGSTVHVKFTYNNYLDSSNVMFWNDSTYLGYIQKVNNKDFSTTVPDNANVMALMINKASEDLTPSSISELQIEYGSVATSYEAFTDSDKYPISFPSEAGTVYGGTLTVNKDGTGTLVVEKADVNLGSLNYSYSNSYFYADAPSDSAPVISNGQPFICEIYKRYVGPLNSMPDFTAGLNNVAFSGIKIFYCKNSRFDNASDFKTAMSGVKLVYPLATPVTYTLTAEQITTLLGTNNIWADTGDVTVTYYNRE